MIKIETLSGQPYDTIYLNETDKTYRDIINHIKLDYPVYNPSKFEHYTMYVKTDIKLFNKGKMINFDDDISFNKEDCVLQIFIKYEYMCYNSLGIIYNFTEENRYEQIINLIKQDGYFINLLIEEEQTEEICKFAVKQNGWSLQHVKNQTEELCKLAVQQDGCALQYVKNQTEEICKLAVQQDGNALSFVKIEQTEEICKFAVKQNGNVLQYVKNQTEEICKLAIQQDGYALKYVPKSMKHLFM